MSTPLLSDYSKFVALGIDKYGTRRYFGPSTSLEEIRNEIVKDGETSRYLIYNFVGVVDVEEVKTKKAVIILK